MVPQLAHMRDLVHTFFALGLHLDGLALKSLCRA